MEMVKTLASMLLTSIFLITWLISLTDYEKRKENSDKKSPDGIVEWLVVVLVPAGSIVYTFYALSQLIVMIIMGE